MDWTRVEEVFHTAMRLPEAERSALLAEQPPDVSEAAARLLRQSNGEGKIARAIQGAVTLATQPSGMMGAYSLVREIGSGGMGTVYLAVRADDQFQKQVAIKLIRRGMDTEDLLNRFRQERQILANLEHPYIARLLDGGASPDGQPFLVMEFLEGKPLDVYCRENNLDLQARCRLFLKVCEAVSFAHQNLVVHRDLKPSNILVGADGSPKLLDFGMAKLLDAETRSGVTAAGAATRPITPDYASPEQFLGATITTAADVYSLGAILFALLTDRAPHHFTNYGLSELERVICKEEAPLASSCAGPWRRQLKGDLDAICSKAIRKETAQRYASVDLLTADLERFLSGRPVLAHQGNLQYKARKFLLRNRLPIAVALVLVASLVAGATISMIQARRADTERLRALASQQEAQRQAGEAERQSGLAEAQRQRAELEKAAAETQHLLADRRFDQVRQLAGKFLLDFNDAIANLPGSTSARKMVVETGLKYFDTLVREAQGDQGLLEEVARGYDRLGDVQGNPYNANLGDFPGALETYRKAQAIREHISDPSPAFLRDRIGGTLRVAEWMAVRGNAAEADRLLKTAFAMARGPGAADYDVRVNLANTYIRYGDLKVISGAFGESIEPFSQALGMLQILAKEERNPIAEQTGISLAHSKLAEALAKMERASEALPHVRAALAIDQPLLQTDPNNLTQLRKVYVDCILLSYVFLSDSGASLVADAEARAALETAARLADQEAAADPKDLRAVKDTRMAQSTWGDFLRDHNDGEGALVHYRRSLEAAQREAAAAPLTIASKESLLQAYHRLARGFLVAGKPGDALEHLRLADGYLSAAKQQNPGLIAWVLWSTNLHRDTARAYARLRDWPAAIAEYQTDLAALDEAVRRDPENGSVPTDRRNVLTELADCYAVQERWSDAAQAIQEALKGLQEIAAHRPLRADEEQARIDGREKLEAWKQRSLERN